MNISNFLNYQSLENLRDQGVRLFNSFREIELTPDCITTLYDRIENDNSYLRKKVMEKNSADPANPNGLSEAGYARLTYRTFQRNGDNLESLSELVDKGNHGNAEIEWSEEEEHKLNSLIFFYHYNRLFIELSKTNTSI